MGKGRRTSYHRTMGLAQEFKKNERNNMNERLYVNYITISEAFKRDGWTCYHKFQAGNYWQKGDDEVTHYLGKFKFNGREVDDEYIHQMLHIDKRFILMCEKLGSHSIHSEYGRAFFAGVKWADANPLGIGHEGKTEVRTIQVADAIAPYPIWGKYGQAFLAGARWADGYSLK